MSTKSPLTITASSITDNGGGTASGTVADIASTFDSAVVSNAIADLVDVVNELVVDVTAIKSALDTSHTQITT